MEVNLDFHLSFCYNVDRCFGRVKPPVKKGGFSLMSKKEIRLINPLPVASDKHGELYLNPQGTASLEEAYL